MNINPSDRRLIENELLIRNSNTKAKNALKQYFAPDKEVATSPINFYCECSDLNCGAVIPITISEYEMIHKKRDQFILRKDHEIHHIEKIVKRTPRYVVVEKFAVAA